MGNGPVANRTGFFSIHHFLLPPPMTLDQFRTECQEAIRNFHDPKLDGMLLVGVRINYAPSVIEPATPIEYMEYSATLGSWPKPTAHPYGGINDEGPIYHDSWKGAATALMLLAKEVWQKRQPEEEPEPMLPSPYDALLD
jgi:hypothetical protein